VSDVLVFTVRYKLINSVVGNLPHGGFASADRPIFVLTSSGPRRATGATSLARDDSKPSTTPQPDNSNHTKRQSHNRRYTTCSGTPRTIATTPSGSHTTDATPRAVGLHCVRPVTNLSARYQKKFHGETKIGHRSQMGA
jgi:hypothetical protein